MVHFSDKDNKTVEEEDYNDKIKKIRHNKPVENLAKLHLNSYTEINTSEEGKKFKQG